jgi:hypothetical protein
MQKESVARVWLISLSALSSRAGALADANFPPGCSSRCAVGAPRQTGSRVSPPHHYGTLCGLGEGCLFS